MLRVVELPEGVNLTVRSERSAEGPEADRDTERLTVPVKPFRLAREMLSKTVPEPAVRVKEDLLGVRVKSTT
jgi:hypothetical protein